MDADSAKRDGSGAVAWTAGLPPLVNPFSFSAAAVDSFRAVGFLYAALLLLMTTPILIWPVPRSWDLVNHWARLTLLTMPASDPLNAIYQVKFDLIPNLAIDFIYLALSWALSPQSVVRLAWAASFLLPAWGAWRIHRALFARPQLTILLVPLVSYNLVVFVGLTNYAIGAGVALLALAWRLRPAGCSFLRALVAINLAACVMFFCHVVALAGFCLMFGMIEATPRPGEGSRAGLRRALISPLSVACALVLLIFAVRPESRYNLEVASGKMLLLVSPWFTNTAGDIAPFLCIGVLLGAAALTGRLGVAPATRWALAGFLAVVLAIKSSWGAAVFLDARLAVFLAYVALASLSFELRGPEAKGFVAILVVACVVRAAAIVPVWSRFEAEVAQFRSALAAAPAGAKAIVASVPEKICVDKNFSLDFNLANFAIIDRRAAASSLFSGTGMQPVKLRDPELEGMPAIAADMLWLSPDSRSVDGRPSPRWAPIYAHWREHFDTLILIHGDCAWRPDEADLVRVGQSGVADIYRAR